MTWKAFEVQYPVVALRKGRIKLISNLLLPPDKHIIVCVDWHNKVMYEQERREESLTSPATDVIFDHLHWIPKATHLLQLCRQDVMSRGSVSFNCSHFSSIYTEGLPPARSYAQKFFVLSILQGKCASFLCFFSPPPPIQSPLCSHSYAGPLHLI